ncbi:tetratricopeptide repeat protein [Gloeothece citriformis]|uniref:tetratricopeptide repeat protein n=1 Tax=Gloeothece citriformis TaxID=2546356 RepID=UPI00030C7C0D|nr:tetratricopeptide repeat protein [Gloeothece citriformis]
MLHEDLGRGDFVAVTGMGGVGKTELVTQYVKRYGEAYGGITWFNDRERGLAAEVFKFFVLQLNYEIPQELGGQRLSLKQQLEWCWSNYPACELPILLVFDDVTHLDNFREVVPSDNRFRVLVTTRLQYLDPNFISEVGLDVLSPENEPGKALELLESLLGTKDKRVQRKPQAAANICQCLEFLPLGIILVGGYLVNEPDLSLERMLQRLQEKKLAEEALQQRESLNKYERGVRAAFALTWEELNPLSQQVGMFLSLFSPKLIHWDLVVGVVCDLSPDPSPTMRGENIDLSPNPSPTMRGENIDIVPPSLVGKGVRGLGLNWSEEKLNEGKKQLYKRNLLQREEEREGCYKIHALVRWFLQERLEESGEIKGVLKQTFATAMITKAKIIPKQPSVTDIENVKDFIPHIEALAESLIEEAKDKRQGKIITSAFLSDEDIIRPFVGVGWFYQGQGLYFLAEPWLKQYVDVLKSYFGEEHPDVATSLNNLAVLYHYQGRYTEAEPLYLQALEMRKQLLGQSHPDVATSLNNLAILYYSMGRYEKAEPLYLEALEMYKQLLGQSHPDVATSLNNLAILYYSMGRYEKAEPLYLEALEMYKQLLGQSHPDVATSLNNLAILYYSMGRYEKAEPLYLEALEMYKQLLGQSHPDVATSLNNLAILYYSMRRYKKAEPLYLEAWEMYKQLLGQSHPLVATSLNNLALLYSSMGHYDKAEPLLLEALEMSKQLLGQSHPDVATSLNNLALLYSSMGRYEKAEPLYLEALEICERVLGNNHPNTVAIRENLDLMQQERTSLDIWSHRLGYVVGILLGIVILPVVILLVPFYVLWLLFKRLFTFLFR